MKQKDIVKFSNPYAGEENLLMRVLEVNEDRVLVESLVNMAILPVSSLSIRDLELAIGTSEKRSLRRDLINTWLHFNHFHGQNMTLDDFKYFVRSDEIDTYGQSMQIYRQM